MEQGVDITFPTSSSPGVRPQESGGRLVNGYVEKAPQGAPSDIIHRRSPGIRQLFDATSLNAAFVHTRGFLDCGTTLLWITDTRVLAVTRSGSVFSAVNLGALTGTLPVTTARNNNATPQNVVVTENGTFNLFTGSAPTAFADADLPGSPTSVCHLDGYFVWTFGDGRVFASDLNSVSVSSLSFYTEQGLFARRVVPFAGRLFVFGDKWSVVLRNIGTSPFPFAREVTIPRGIIGTHAVAGHEVGWQNELVFAADDFLVYKLSGYTPTPLSNDAVSRDIQSAALAGDGDLLEAHVYMFGRNAFWALTYPGNWTWELNLSTGEWNQRKSYNRDDWRGRRSIKIFDRWITGDAVNGKLYEVTGDYYREGDDPLIWEVESGIISSFPNGIVIPEVAFFLTAGVGTLDTEDDPQVRISWSFDGGHTYGNPVLRRIGGPGETRNPVKVRNCGLSKGFGVRFKLQISDPVHVGLSGGKIEPELRMVG